MLDLEPVELGDVADVAQVLEARVGRRDAEDLVVAAGLVGHPEHADRAALDQAAGEGRLLQEHERVERVAVQAEGVLDVAVVGGVLRRGEQRPVEADPTGLVVDLVLVALALGDLYQDVELHCASSMPRPWSASVSVPHDRGKRGVGRSGTCRKVTEATSLCTP